MKPHLSYHVFDDGIKPIQAAKWKGVGLSVCRFTEGRRPSEPGPLIVPKTDHRFKRDTGPARPLMPTAGGLRMLRSLPSSSTMFSPDLGETDGDPGTLSKESTNP